MEYMAKLTTEDRRWLVEFPDCPGCQTFGASTCTAGMEAGTVCMAGSCIQGGMMACTDGLCGSDACQTVTQVGVGGSFACALISDGTMRCWGRNNFGQLGQGGTDTMGRLRPTAVPGLSGVTSISVGANHACAIIGSGSTAIAKCWAYNADGELGLGTSDTTGIMGRTTPTQVPNLSGILQLAASEYNTCAVLADHTAKCWGGDCSNGNFGDGTNVSSRTSPSTVCTTGNVDSAHCVAMTGINQITPGDFHACTLKSDSSVRCWGRNDSGQMGLPPDLNPHDNPVMVRVFRWARGQLGNGATSTTQPTPAAQMW